MWPALLRHTQNASVASLAASPLLLVVLSGVRGLGTSSANTLAVNTATWAIIWAYSAFRAGVFTGFEYGIRTKYCLAGGALLSLAAFCERAACSWDAVGWPKSFLPLTIQLIVRSNLLRNPIVAVNETNSVNDEPLRRKDHQWHLLTLTICSMIVLECSYNTFQNVTFGLCYTLLTAAGLVLMEYSIKCAANGVHSTAPGFVSANGSLHLRSTKGDGYEMAMASLRDVSGIITAISGTGAFLVDSIRLDTLLYPTEHSNMLYSVWSYSRRVKGIFQLVTMVFIGTAQIFFCFKMLRRHGAILTSFAILGGAVLTELIQLPSIYKFWFTAICFASVLFYIGDAASLSSFSLGPGKTMRTRSAVSVVAVFSFIIFTFSSLQRHSNISSFHYSSEQPKSPGLNSNTYDSVDLPSGVHPVYALVQEAESQFQDTLNRQSKTLSEAVKEYKRRYFIPPPPNFDRWYEFAKKRDVQLIDEFDTIYHSLLPFWAIEPSLLRRRVREALGYEENLLTGVLIRNGQTVYVDGKSDWLKEALVKMMNEFKQFLPDMDLAFNEHDEPRIMIPDARLSAIVELARKEHTSVQNSGQVPRNYFSSRPNDLNDGSRIEEFKRTKFNRFAHQATWTHSRLSCSPDSPAQDFSEMVADNISSYALGELRFIYNLTAFTDICMSPSLEDTYGFFDRPNAFSIAHDLIPVFSQSKISSYQDILYPSPWYWYEKVKYDEHKDVTWEKKEEKLYWRGSTTGGYSRNGSWRRHHRQHLVKRLNAPDVAQILRNTSNTAASKWVVQDVERNNYKDLIDVKFTYIGQCDPDDKEAQEEFFEVVENADQQQAWNYKYLLDMDGNAFSGRFYAFLRSKSLAFKMALFREWHMEWLKPWLHYVPLSLKGDEWLESLRFLIEEPTGRLEAEKIAAQSRDWAKKVLRNEDLEVWLFRLLLEYGRVVDDNRTSIGYSDI